MNKFVCHRPWRRRRGRRTPHWRPAVGSPERWRGFRGHARHRPTATAEPTATPEPSPSPPASAPPLTETFTSRCTAIPCPIPRGGRLEPRPSPGRIAPARPSSFTPVSTCCTTRSHRSSVPAHQPRSRSAIPRPRIGSRRDGERRMHDNRTHRRRWRHRTDGAETVTGRRHYRRPRLLDLALTLGRRPSRRRPLRQGMVRGGPRHRPAPSRGRRRCGAVRVPSWSAVHDSYARIVLSFGFYPRPDSFTAGPAGCPSRPFTRSANERHARVVRRRDTRPAPHSCGCVFAHERPAIPFAVPRATQRRALRPARPAPGRAASSSSAGS